MAKKWFTTLPDKYFMKQARRGGRRELLFTAVVLGFAHFGLFNPLRASYYNRQSFPEWNRTTVDSHPVTY